MIVKLSHTINNRVPEKGEVFIYHQTYYLRIEPVDIGSLRLNTVNLSSNELCYFDYFKMCFNSVKIIDGAFVENNLK